MKILATVLMASALMAGCSNFASQRNNAVNGNMSEAKKTSMQNGAPDMPTRASDGRLIGPNGNTIYVFGKDTDEAFAVAQRIDSGAIHVNGALSSTYAPFGGIKTSGLGHERGIEGMRLFQRLTVFSVSG